jgi:hypothetical protein
MAAAAADLLDAIRQTVDRPSMTSPVDIVHCVGVGENEKRQGVELAVSRMSHHLRAMPGR